LPQDAVDCGPHKGICQAGNVCWTAPLDVLGVANKGQTICTTPTGRTVLDQQVRDISERLKQERQKQQADARFDANLRTILRNRRASAEEKQIAAIALGKDPSAKLQSNGKETSVVDRDLIQKALDKVSPNTAASSDANWIAIANDPTEPLGARRLAAAIAGIDLNKVGTGLVAKPLKTADVMVGTASNSISSLSNEVILNAFSSNGLAASSVGSTGYTGPTQTQGACLALAAQSTSAYATPGLRAAMCDPSADLAGRMIVAGVLGLNMNLVLPISGAGTLQSLSNQVISRPSVWSGIAGDLSVAVPVPPSSTQNVKAPASKGPTVTPIELIQTNSTFANSISATVQDQSGTTNPLDALENFYTSPLGSSVLDVASAAGGAVIEGGLGDAIDLTATEAKVAVLYEKGDYLGIGEVATSLVTTTAAQTAGAKVGLIFGGSAGAKVGAAVGASVAQGALDLGTEVVAPRLGDIIYEFSPASFAP
jgi:hypothetical protein